MVAPWRSAQHDRPSRGLDDPVPEAGGFDDGLDADVDRVGRRRARDRIGRRLSGLAHVLRKLDTALGVPHAHRVRTSRPRCGLRCCSRSRSPWRASSSWSRARRGRPSATPRAAVLHGRCARAAVRRAGRARRSGREQRARPRGGHAAFRARDDRARRRRRRYDPQRSKPPVEAATEATRRLAMGAAIATFALLLVGTYVRAEGAGLAFRDWPLMGGRLLPSFGPRGAAGDVRAPRARDRRGRARAVARGAGAHDARAISRRSSGSPRWPARCSSRRSWSAASTSSPSSPRGRAPLHVAMSAAIWATMVALAVVARRQPASQRRSAQQRAPIPPCPSRRRSATRSPPTSGSRSLASSCCC